MKAITKFGDWLLYWNSKDERLRSGADRAGHVALYFFLWPQLIVFMLIAAQIIPKEYLVLQMIELAIFILTALVYAILWIRKGLTMMDSKKQRRSMTLYIIVFSVAASALYSLWGLGSLSWQARLLSFGVSVLVSILVAFLVVRVMEHLAQKRAESLAGDSETEGLEVRK